MPAIHQLSTQAKHNVWIIAINEEDPITSQGALDKLNIHQTPRGKYKVNISLCRRKGYKRTDFEDVHSIFDPFRPVVSNIEVCIPKKPPNPNNINEGLKVPLIKLFKEYLFVQYENNKHVSLL